MSEDMLKAGSKAMIYGFHVVLSAVWQSGEILHYWKRELVVPVWKRKEA